MTDAKPRPHQRPQDARAATGVGVTIPAAVEMAAPWKPKTGFHRALEISRRARDSHIPTADAREGRIRMRRTEAENSID